LFSAYSYNLIPTSLVLQHQRVGLLADSGISKPVVSSLQGTVLSTACRNRFVLWPPWHQSCIDPAVTCTPLPTNHGSHRHVIGRHYSPSPYNR